LTLCFPSDSSYVCCLDGVAESLNLCGSLFYLTSSLLPLASSSLAFFDVGELEEGFEAELDEITYALDAMAMIFFATGSLLYLIIWKRNYRGSLSCWFPPLHSLHSAPSLCSDAELWSNIWNVAGSTFYCLSIFYGLSIRIHLAARESLNTNPSSQLLPLQRSSLNVSGWVDADDYSDLTVWQRALYGLTAQQKMMMSLGDCMYLVCAVLVEIAHRQQQQQTDNNSKQLQFSSNSSSSQSHHLDLQLDMDHSDSSLSSTNSHHHHHSQNHSRSRGGRDQQKKSLLPNNEKQLLTTASGYSTV